MVLKLFNSRDKKRKEFLDSYFTASLHQFYSDTCNILVPGNYLLHPPSLLEVGAYLYACSVETYGEYKPRKAKANFGRLGYDFERVAMICLANHMSALFQFMIEASGHTASPDFLDEVGVKVIEFSKIRLETRREHLYRTNFTTLVGDETRGDFMDAFIRKLCVDPEEPSLLVNYEYALAEHVRAELESVLVNDFMAGTRAMFAQFSG